MPNPRNASEVRSFLGMTGYSSRFIPDYATLTKPLRDLTRSDTPWVWTREHENAMTEINIRLMKKPVVAYFDCHKCTELVVDGLPVILPGIL